MGDIDEFRSAVAAFLDEAVAADEHCPAFGAIMPPGLHERARSWQRRMFDAGYAGLHWPAEFGGRGLTRAHTAVWSEECARRSVQSYINLQGIILAGEALLRSGTDGQKARFLEPTLTGDMLWCQLFSEPGAGSDLAGLSTAAVLDGDHYVVNGQKVWCSNGQFAEYGILLARTDPEVRGHRGISFFLLDMSSPGVDVRPLRQMTGDEEFTEVFLDDVEVPIDHLLGAPGSGWQVAMEVLQDERGSVGSSGVITLDRRLDGLAALVTSRSAVDRDRLAALLVQGRALRSTLVRSASDPGAASTSKLARTELEFAANDLEASLRGPAAMLNDERTETFLYSPGMRIAGGTSEIQRNIIGERVLGLPKG